MNKEVAVFRFFVSKEVAVFRFFVSKEVAPGSYSQKPYGFENSDHILSLSTSHSLFVLIYSRFGNLNISPS